jgi:hypothetical protein
MERFGAEFAAVAQNYCVNFGCCPPRVFNKAHPKCEPAMAYSPVVKSERIEGEMVYFDYNMVLAEDGNYFNVMTGLQNSVKNAKNLQKAQILYLKDFAKFAILPLHGGYCSILDGRIALERSSIRAIAYLGDSLFATVGSDCIVYIWNLPNITEYLYAIPVHAVNITQIDGSARKNVVVMVTEKHKVFVYMLHEMKCKCSFKIDCDEGCRHRLCLCENGLIAVTCELVGSKTYTVKWFDVHGREWGSLALEGTVVKFFGVVAKNSEAFVVVTEAVKRVIVLDCSQFVIVKEFGSFLPRLVGRLDEAGRSLLGVRYGGSEARVATIMTF